MNFNKEIVLTLLKKELPSLKALYLFGSVASEQNTSTSDIDLAFLSKESISSLQRFDLSQVLAQSLNKDVDLIDLNEASEVLRFEIISKGKRLFSDETQEVEDFEDKVYMLYIDLNENRMGILEDIAKRGTVY